MKQFMMKHLMLSCRQACLLMAKKEEGKLNTANRLRLRLHTALCAVCKRFEQQCRLISSESSAIESSAALTMAAKEHMRRSIEDCR